MDNFTRAFNSLLDACGIKMAVSTFVVCSGISLNFFVIFAVLVLIDTITKWIALAYAYGECTSVFEAIKAIPEAHRAKVIDSHDMRVGFFNKMITYLILMAAAALTDHLFTLAHGSPVFIHLVVTYLSATEFLSIVENLDGAGVSAMAGLLNLVKKVAQK